MPERFSFEKIALSVSGKAEPASVKRDEDSPFRVLVLGDFSGRASRLVSEPLAGRRAIKIDVDNFEDVLARAKPLLAMQSADGTSCEISFRRLDDFHPDRLLERLPHFDSLRETRKALRSPATAREAAAQVASWAGGSAPPSPKAAPDTDEDTFARLLGATPGEVRHQSAGAQSNVQDFIRGLVAPHIVAGRDPNVDAMTAAVDAALASQMRAVLHDPAFQKLEASWRALDFLLRNLETDETLTVHMLDVSKAELAADLRGGEDLARSALFKILVEETVQTPGSVPWALIAGDYTFGPGDDDADLLARIGKIAAAAGAPFLAGAGRAFIEMAGNDGGHVSDAWEALRRTTQARWIGLAAPRFLLRVPYGESSEEIDTFNFEELAVPPSDEAFLWGNPSFACACMIGQAFRENAWDFAPDDVNELSGLPLHTFEDDGEKKMTPCAELWLTDKRAEKLLAHGIMPLLSIRGRDAARILRFQSIAHQPTPLAGRWN